jgi:hypothetical protein
VKTFTLTLDHREADLTLRALVSLRADMLRSRDRWERKNPDLPWYHQPTLDNVQALVERVCLVTEKPEFVSPRVKPWKKAEKKSADGVDSNGRDGNM